MITNIFEAAAKVEQHVKTITPETVTHKTGVIAIDREGRILASRSTTEATRLNAGSGYIFEYCYRNGNVEVHPVGF